MSHIEHLDMWMVCENMPHIFCSTLLTCPFLRYLSLLPNIVFCFKIVNIRPLSIFRFTVKTVLTNLNKQYFHDEFYRVQLYTRTNKSRLLHNAGRTRTKMALITHTSLVAFRSEKYEKKLFANRFRVE